MHAVYIYCNREPIKESFREALEPLLITNQGRIYVHSSDLLFVS